jgi:hypothetical protein
MGMQSKLVKLYRTDHSVQLYTIQRGRRRNGMFVLLDAEVRKFLDEGRLAIFDGTHVAEFRRIGNHAEIQLRWGRNYTGDKLECDIEWVKIPFENLRSIFYMEPEQVIYALDSFNKPNHVKLVFDGAQERLHEVLGNKTTHRKFIKAIMRFQNWSGEKITFWPDFVENSFYWEETCAGRRVMNGGLIWHGDRYGMHT